MERLAKESSRKRWAEVRQLWNAWDPIGVASSDLQDEYDAYLGPTLRLLEQSASVQELSSYLSSIVGEYMGLGESGIRDSKPVIFAERLITWYQLNWQNTHV